MLKQTIYRSRCADALDLKTVTAEILSVSQRNNPERGITGGLATLDGLFVQIIEGEADAVDKLLLKLYRDDRHSDLQIISTRIISSRSFKQWAMAHAQFPGPEQVAVGRVFDDPFAEPDVLSELMLTALLS